MGLSGKRGLGLGGTDRLHLLPAVRREVVRLISLCTGGLCHLIFLIYFYRLCGLLLQRQLAIWLTMATVRAGLSGP